MTDFSHALKGMMLAAFGFSFFTIGDTFLKFMTDSGFTVIQTAYCFATVIHTQNSCVFNPFFGLVF